MKHVSMLIVFSFVLFLVGCNNQCLTVEGTYKEWAGGVTWCFDKAESQAASQPVVQNEDGDRAILVSEADTILITEILSKETLTQDSMVTPSRLHTASVSNFAEFAKFLDKVKQKKQ